MPASCRRSTTHCSPRRATDLGDVGNRVLAFLAGVDDTDAELPGHPVVLVADDLTPSDTAAIDPC